MSEIQFDNCLRFCGFCALAFLMFMGVVFVAVGVYWLARQLLADVAGKPYPKLTREDVAGWCQNNKVASCDLFDGI